MTATALLCPRCDHTAQAVGLLAAHLAEFHLVSPAAALAEARDALEMERPPATRAEVLADPYGLDRNGIKKYTAKGDTPMRKEPCSECGTRGPRHKTGCSVIGGSSKSAQRAKACGYCHRADGSHSKNCKRAQGTRRRKPAGRGASSKRPRAGVSRNGAAAISDSGVKGHALALVTELLALRDRLDEKIKHVQELAEIL